MQYKCEGCGTTAEEQKECCGKMMVAMDEATPATPAEGEAAPAPDMPTEGDAAPAAE